MCFSLFVVVQRSLNTILVFMKGVSWYWRPSGRIAANILSQSNSPIVHKVHKVQSPILCVFSLRQCSQSNSPIVHKVQSPILCVFVCPFCFQARKQIFLNSTASKFWRGKCKENLISLLSLRCDRFFFKQWGTLGSPCSWKISCSLAGVNVRRLSF